MSRWFRGRKGAPQHRRRDLAEPDRDRIWIDVGAHLGEKTFASARADPRLRVFAFEPNFEVAVKLAGALPNFIVLPLAVHEEEGCKELHITDNAAASSLLPYNENGLAHWRGPGLDVRKTTQVSTIRLDTFFELAGIRDVEFLKIDAQGMDLAVVRSLGRFLPCVKKIELEVQVSSIPLYEGSATESEVMSYMSQRGFDVTSREEQTDGQERNLTFVRRTE